MLTQVAGTQVCPSDDVDQAWHLHITRTADYERFCHEVLGRFLHHWPAEAGVQEHERHLAMYSATLHHYRRAFGAEAPDTVWPAADRRFDAAPPSDVAPLRLRGVFASGLLLALAGLVAVAILALALNLLGLLDATHAMSGPAFLRIAVPVTMALLALGWLSTSPFARSSPRDTLDAYEAAWLMGAEGRMAATAIGLLIERGRVALRTRDERTGWRRLSITQLVVAPAPRRDGLHRVELACLDAARDGLLTMALAHAAMRPEAQRIRWRLRAAGLATDGAAIAPARAAMAGVTAAWLVVAIERVVHAFESPRPVGNLVVLTLLCIASFAALTLRLGRPNRRGRRALRELLQRLRTQRERALSRARKAAGQPVLDGRLLPMTLALLGPTAVLAEPIFVGLDQAFGRHGMRLANADAITFGSDGSSDGGGGGGGGGGGCSGGCGGGCGG